MTATTEPSERAVLPIARDESFDRTYIPLPDGWEIQTKGKGSSFRIARSDNRPRYIVSDEHLHAPLEAIARACHAALIATDETIAALRRDAERYRWLRENCENVADEYGRAGQLYFGTYAHGELDTAIDAALRQAETEGG
jgi:hypothetical protein